MKKSAIHSQWIIVLPNPIWLGYYYELLAGTTGSVYK